VPATDQKCHYLLELPVLSQTIAQQEDSERRQELLAAVKSSLVVSWRHVNLHGEYDFPDEKMQDSVGLHMPPELALSVP
jgi:hypothetical protein